jgi:thiol-disulfide isomerase/thioredoxin
MITSYSLTRRGRKSGHLSALVLALLAGLAMGEAQSGAVDNAWDLPPLRLEALGGGTKDLYDWHGRVMVLNFWATWCGPCQTEVPHLIHYQDRYSAAGLQVVGVALDVPRKVRNFARTLGINYPVLLADPASERILLPRWGNPSRGLPFTVVIGRDGHIHYMLNGILDDESFDEYVLPLLQSPDAGAATP